MGKASLPGPMGGRPARAEWAVLKGHTHSLRWVCAVWVDGRELLASASDDRTGAHLGSGHWYR
jgi:hypothetical protein